MPTDESGWPQGIGLIQVGEIDSTNLEGRRLAASIEVPTWILAESQTGGRGRGGRNWVSPKGNLHATLVMPLEGPVRDAPLRSMIASVALRDALDGFLGGREGLKVKWPNDVLLDGGKVAGILLETAGQGDGIRILIGIGVNLLSAPGLPERSGRAPRPVSILGTTGRSIGPDMFLEGLARSFDRREMQFRASGFEPIRRDWLRWAWRLGREAAFSMERSTVRGIFETVDPDGCAVVLADGKRRRIAAADMLCG